MVVRVTRAGRRIVRRARRLRLRARATFTAAPGPRSSARRSLTLRR
jgi:hypothetical protein